jgi:hypothetical protein
MATKDLEMDLLNANENIGKNVFQLLIMIICFSILIYFLLSYIVNILHIFKDYHHTSLKVHNHDKKIKEDNNIYERDSIYYDSNKNEILKSLNTIQSNYEQQFDKIKTYKDNKNSEYELADKDTRLDTNIYSVINSKVLTDKNDDYNYEDSYNPVTFFFDIFKPVSN